jgi:hypothetical protein
MFLNHLRNPFLALQTGDANFSKLAGTHLVEQTDAVKNYFDTSFIKKSRREERSLAD